MDFIQIRSHIKLVCVQTSSIYLNTSILFDSYSLTLSLFLSLVCKPDYIWQVSFCTLVNSGSTYYFADFSFIHAHNLLTLSVLSVELYLFNRSSNNFISELISLSIYLWIFIKAGSFNFTTFFNTPLLESKMVELFSFTVPVSYF